MELIVAVVLIISGIIMTSFRRALSQVDEIEFSRENRRTNFLKEDIMTERKSYLNTLFIGSIFTYIMFYVIFSPILVDFLVPILIDTLPNPSTVVHVYGVKQKSYFISSLFLPIAIAFFALLSDRIGENYPKKVLINMSYPIFFIHYSMLLIFFIPIKLVGLSNYIIEKFI